MRAKRRDWWRSQPSDRFSYHWSADKYHARESFVLPRQSDESRDSESIGRFILRRERYYYHGAQRDRRINEECTRATVDFH